MGGAESRTASSAEQLAHARPVVERCLAWSGLVPLPVFLLLHLAHELRLAFANDVSDVLRSAPGPFEKLTSLCLVWLPLALHLGIAAVLQLSRRAPRALLNDVPPVSRLLSRISSVLALAFLAYHANAFPISVWLGRAAAEDAGFRLLGDLSSTTSGVPLVAGLYLLGLVATVTHAALGVHRGLLAEGLLITAGKRRTSARACAGVGALLFCTGAAAVIRVASGVLLR
jgi:succinate dehydrogenase cytochrome b subunit